MRGKRALEVAALRQDIDALIKTFIFSEVHVGTPLFRAAYLWLIVNLHDFLQATAVEGDPIVLPNSDADAVHLIQRARYALVHAGAAYGREDSGRTMRVTVGAATGHADDIAVEVGGIRILLRRHAVDAFEMTCLRLDAAEARIAEDAH